MNKGLSATKVKMEDIISNLPPNIIQIVLTLMPMRDAFRTSILSRNWRSHCVTIPRLMFDDQVFLVSALKNLSNKYKLLHIIYPILLLHQGSILEFSLCFSQLSSCCEIDQIILHLSRNGVSLKKFSLCIGEGDAHKLLPSFFMVQQLTHLKLKKCVFQPPVTFNGFSKMTSLYFENVSITAKVLLRFLINCPLLKSFTLIADEYLVGSWKFEFVELFECLPLIEHLHMSSCLFKCFATGVIPHNLPTSLVHLKNLHLSGMCFAREDELQSALLLVTSSPNIEKIKLEMCYDPKIIVSQTAMNLLDLQDYSDVMLDHLCELEMTSFSNKKPEMDFVKLIVSKSRMLKKVGIVIDQRVAIQDEVKMLKELLQYPRASTRAEIVFVRGP